MVAATIDTPTTDTAPAVKKPARVKGQKMVVPQAPLAAALGTVVRFVDPKNPVALLQRVVLERADDGLRVTGGDHALACRVVVPCDADAFPPIALMPDLLHKTVGGFPDADVAFEMEKQGMLLLSCGGYRGRLHVLDAAAYPPFARIEADDATRFAVDAHALAEALGAVQHAQAKEAKGVAPRPELAAVRFAAQDGHLVLTACDGYRGAQQRVPIEGELPAPFSVVVPWRTVGELRGVLAGVEKGPASVATDRKRLWVAAGLVEVASPLIVAPYPDFDKIVRAVSAAEATVPIKEWQAALKVVAPVAAQVDGQRIEVTHEGAGRTTVSAEVAEVGRAEQAFASPKLTHNTGDPTRGAKYAVNGAYLADALASFKGETEVVVGVESPVQAVILRGATDRSRLALVMPLVPKDDGVPAAEKEATTKETEEEPL